MSGRKLGHYEIIAPLGSGGMGEVYRARDTHLERDVALKVLTGELSRDSELLARFEREAKLLAAVNHPNIAGIHSIERFDDKPVLVLELVEGRSLAQRLDEGRPSLIEALDVCRQIADGLAAAHARQVIHRDLKPANIMVTSDGAVKLLDFGIAKTVAIKRPDTPTEPVPVGRNLLTSTGVILGTAPYMSPEQVRGRDLDARSDIWSFGCVLFEVLAGQSPFERDTVGDTLAAIVGAEVDWNALPPNTPAAVRGLLRRCLQPDLRQRLRDFADVRIELEEVLQSLRGAVTAGGRRARGRRRNRVGPAAILAVLVVAFVLLETTWLEQLSDIAGSGDGDAATRALPLTSLVGSEIDPSLSPDGRFVAFAWDGENPRGNYDIYVQQVGGGEPLRLTEGGTDARMPRWAPDGDEIVFLRRTERGWRIEAVPPLGGTARSVKEISAVFFPGLDVSPDGEQLAVVHQASPGAEESIFLVSRRTGTETRVSTPPLAGIGDRAPAFAPDGRSLVFVRWHESPHNEIFITDFSGNTRLVATHEAYVEAIDWLPDGSGLIFSSSLGGSSSLWHVDLNGSQRQLGFGDSARGVALANDVVVYSRRQSDSNLWIVGGPAATEVAAPRRLIASTRDDWAPQFSPDGSKIAFMSIRSGEIRIWICASDGTECAQMQSEGLASTPRWSPDGSRLVFGGETGGNTDIRIVDLNGGVPRTIVEGGPVNLATGWSADGRWVYFTSDRSGEMQIWKVEVDTGEMIQLTESGGLLGQEADAGNSVFYMRERTLFSIWRVPVAGGEERMALEHPGLTLSAFTVWNDALVYPLREPGKAISVQILDPETGAVRDIFRFDESMRLGRYGRITVSPDGQWIVYPREDGGGSDLMIVRNFQ